ncbi:hypothetical protein [Salinicola sp. CPA57]|uniref:hypothetical protein n=1 Tax=Salinicola sp. CPA57 TaxID=1949080 RepID=UPI000DA2092E|nr:hypothetical protein [Salinicola sp. CPA57]
MKLKLIPQCGDNDVSFSALGQVLTVIVNGSVETFDFTSAGDGTFNGFESDVLPSMPLLSATKTDGVIEVLAIGCYGPEPVREEEETDDAFQARHAEWDALRFNREVEI